MSQTVSSQRVAANPVRALIIWPDDTYELRTVEQEIEVFQGIVGGWVEVIPTEHCCFWRDEDGEGKGCPTNTLATYLWWKLCPAMEAKDMLSGTVFVTGSAEGEPLPDEVVELFKGIERIYREEEGA